VSLGLQAVCAERLATEDDLYRGMNSSHTDVRQCSKRLYDRGFDLLHEIQQQVRCQNLPGVLKVEAVVVAAEPCAHIRGLMTQFCPRGTLEDVLR
jgi:hypothetical protein